MFNWVCFVGTFRCFGKFGPPYEVLGSGTPGRAGEPRLRVRLIKTGEEVEYEFEHFLTDPEHV